MRGDIVTVFQKIAAKTESIVSCLLHTNSRRCVLVDTEKQRKWELISKGGQESFRKILNWEIIVREFWLCYFQGQKNKNKKKPKL